ncbi:MAG: hypothetical protein HY927_00400 [Elusimicrobia bacterium]|nr:hypothetical protein [Elusimicrobiota bacterium]
MKPCALLLTLLLAAGRPASAASVINSKHDLSFDSATTGPKAVSEKDTCVFCHNSHKPAIVKPLWNRSNSAQTFTFYSSNYLNTYLGMAQPTMADLAGSKTKLCLSCHDGVTALGAVYNLAPNTIAMTGAMGAAAILGTDLRNDHPVLYGVKPGAGPPTQPGTNPEIQLPPGGDAVKVYGANNLVECTSCHNPHDNQYGKFLVKSNANASLCTTCHVKTNYSTSVHATSNVAYTPSGGAATTIREWSCRNCHKTHGASSAQAYLLAAAEENTCYACHGNPALTGAKNIKSSFAKTYKHKTETVSGVHKDPETDASNLGLATRHSECWDCHNPHQTKTGAHASPGNLIGGVLLGAWGVEPSWGASAWTAATTYVRQVFANTTGYKEYQLCLKCHSYYAFGASPPAGITDQTIEFNPLNASRHPVFGVGSNSYCTPTTTNGNVVTMVAPWNQTANSHGLMTCTDCHGSDVTTDPKGPHGSAAQRILRASLVAVKTGANFVTPLCVKCHKETTYGGSSAGSRFQEHDRGAHFLASTATGAGGYGGCLACHGNLTGGVSGTFHGENTQWAATTYTTAGPALRFMNNSTNFVGWSPGKCKKKTCSTLEKPY